MRSSEREERRDVSDEERAKVEWRGGEGKKHGPRRNFRYRGVVVLEPGGRVVGEVALVKEVWKRREAKRRRTVSPAERDAVEEVRSRLTVSKRRVTCRKKKRDLSQRKIKRKNEGEERRTSMHENRRELVLRVLVATPDILDLSLESPDLHLRFQNLHRDGSSSSVQIVLEVVVELSRGKPIRRWDDVFDESRHGFGERTFLEKKEDDISQRWSKGSEKGRKRGSSLQSS